MNRTKLRSIIVTDSTWQKLKMLAALKCKTMQIALAELIEKEPLNTQVPSSESLAKDLDRQLANTLKNIKGRCEYPGTNKYRYYGGKGIKNYLTLDDLRFLWKRDRADKMIQPSIDRLSNAQHYTLENCRFIEMDLNRRNRWRIKDVA